MPQPSFRILPRPESDRATAALFQDLPTAVISDSLNRMPGTWGLMPFHRPGTALLGTALTVRVRSGDNLMVHKALQLGRPGDVLVVDAGGAVDRAIFGDIMKQVAQMRGFAGVVIDGAIRDAAAYREDTFGCYARGVCFRGPYKEGPGEINVPVTIAGAVVNPGDVVVGDDDGVLFIPADGAAAVAEAARKKAAAEAATIDSIAQRKYDDKWIDEVLKAKGVL